MRLERHLIRLPGSIGRPRYRPENFIEFPATDPRARGIAKYLKQFAAVSQIDRVDVFRIQFFVAIMATTDLISSSVQ